MNGKKKKKKKDDIHTLCNYIMLYEKKTKYYTQFFIIFLFNWTTLFYNKQPSKCSSSTRSTRNVFVKNEKNKKQN